MLMRTQLLPPEKDAVKAIGKELFDLSCPLSQEQQQKLAFKLNIEVVECCSIEEVVRGRQPPLNALLCDL